MKDLLFLVLIFSSVYSYALEPEDRVYINSTQTFERILYISESGKVSMYHGGGRIYDISDLEPAVTHFNYGNTQYSPEDRVYINSTQTFERILYISESGKVSMYYDGGRIYDISDLEKTTKEN